MTFVPSPFAKRTQVFVTHNKEKNICASNIAASDLVYVCNSEEAEISVCAPRCMKIIVEGNKNSTVKIQCNAITTGFVEIMKCQDVKIVFDSMSCTKVRTLQLDTMKDCHVQFVIGEDSEKVLSELCPIAKFSLWCNSWNQKLFIT